MKKSASFSNVGVAFVSFKDKDCVAETIDELDLVKTKLVGKEHYDDLDIKNWEVEVAQPVNDIIWNEINNGRSRSLPTRITLNLIPLSLSTFVIFSLIYLD